MPLAILPRCAPTVCSAGCPSRPTSPPSPRSTPIRAPARSARWRRCATRTWRTHWRRFNRGAWAIEALARPGWVVGFGGVTQRAFDGEDLPNLWYRFAPGAWGQGYATEFAAAAVADAHARGGLDEIHALALPDNHASIRVLGKLGMRPNGMLQAERGTCERFVLRLDGPSAGGRAAGAY